MSVDCSLFLSLKIHCSVRSFVSLSSFQVLGLNFSVLYLQPSLSVSLEGSLLEML